MINEICKECGGQVIDLILTSMPPISRKECMKCHRIIEEHREEMITREV